MYPIAVLLLVEKDRSLNNTSFYSSGSAMNFGRDQQSRAEPISFAPGPTRLSSSHIGSEKTGRQNTNILRLTFGSIVELADTEASGGSNEDPNEDKHETA
jgi:hypothetical protein